MEKLTELEKKYINIVELVANMKNNAKIVRVKEMENLEVIGEIILQNWAKFNDYRVYAPSKVKMHDLYKEVNFWLKDVNFEINAIKNKLLYTLMIGRTQNDLELLKKYQFDLLRLKSHISDSLLLKL